MNENHDEKGRFSSGQSNGTPRLRAHFQRSQLAKMQAMQDKIMINGRDLNGRAAVPDRAGDLAARQMILKSWGRRA